MLLLRSGGKFAAKVRSEDDIRVLMKICMTAIESDAE
jgi:hypothetical protein